MTLNSKKKNFKINKGIWKNYSLYKLYKEAKTPFNWHQNIFDYAKKIGIICFSTPFDEKVVISYQDLESQRIKWLHTN